MFTIICFGILALIFLIIFIMSLFYEVYVDAFLLSLCFAFIVFGTIKSAINYSEKTIPNFVYRNDTYKIYQYKCSDNISVNIFKNDDDKFYLPESLLFVRCSGELDRK